MKKLICIFAGAALIGACEQKTEVVNPSSTPTQTMNSLTGERPKNKAKSDVPSNLSAAGAEKKVDPDASVDSNAVATPAMADSAATPAP